MVESDTAVDLLDRRLGHILTLVNIAGALLALGYMVVAIDEMTGGQLKREYERRRDTYRQMRQARAEYLRSLRRVEFEVWRTFREADNERS